MSATSRLREYRKKRNFSRTPEPRVGTSGRSRMPRFVVQKHKATTLHYDFRLQVGPVLKSWSVPKGPSLDPKVKRLAIATEDHPLEYATFEGVIPEGEYGAGEMIVWDLGRYEPVEDLEEGFRKGKLLFDLHGYKLRGRWTLVRIKNKEARAGADDGRTW